MVRIVGILAGMMVLLLFAACASTTPPEQPSPQPAVPGQPTTPTTPSDGGSQPQLQPSTPTTPAATPDDCPLTADRVKAVCIISEPVVKKEGCVFEVEGTGFGTRSGSVSIVEETATQDDYVNRISAIYIGEETYELKPRSARREKTPNSYFFWWKDGQLITGKSTTALCPTDRLKKLLVEYDQGPTLAATCEQLKCTAHTYSDCPQGCNAECRPTTCTPDGVCTKDCEGAGSCRCV